MSVHAAQIKIFIVDIVFEIKRIKLDKIFSTKRTFLSLFKKLSRMGLTSPHTPVGSLL